MALLLLLLPLRLAAFEISGQKWPGGYTDIFVNLDGRSATGISWKTALIGAMKDWNDATRFDFEVHNAYGDPCGDDNLNGVDFTADVCGTEFGTNTLAVTLRKFVSQVLGPPYLVEADIVIRDSASFDIYDGPLNQLGTNFAGLDFGRVILHELGHVMGLDHEPSQPAIMAPRIGNLFQLTADDIAAVNTLYGGLDNCVIKDLAFGITRDALEAGDCTVAEMTVGGDDTSFIDVYRLQLASTTTLQLEMRSPSLDSVLLVADQDLRYLEADDNSAGPCDSRLEVSLQPGNYFVLANTYVDPPQANCGNLGQYSLDVSFQGQDLLALGGNSSLNSGTPGSVAGFFGGVTADGGQTWGNQFRSTDSLDILARIDIDPAHQLRQGFLVVAAKVEDQVLFLNGQGAFEAPSANQLVIRADSRRLSATEEISIATGLVPADLGIDTISVDFFVGYGLEFEAGELYFHTHPFNLTITP